MNKFVILVGSRNNGQWVKDNISSILSQDYQDYKVVYYNDASDDNTDVEYKNIVGDNPKFTYIKSDTRKLKTWFYDNLESYVSINDNDIIVFLHVDDLSEALYLIMKQYNKKEFINIGSSYEVTMKELFNNISKAVDYKGEIEFDTSKPDGTISKLIDSSRIKELGWEPKIKLDDGLSQVYNWFKENIK